MLKKILIKGAKEHNLKNISLEIPKEKLVVITGLSGSGKSSLIRGVLLEGVKASMTNGKKTITEHSYILRNGNVFGKAIEVTQDRHLRFLRQKGADQGREFAVHEQQLHLGILGDKPHFVSR